MSAAWGIRYLTGPSTVIQPARRGIPRKGRPSMKSSFQEPTDSGVFTNLNPIHWIMNRWNSRPERVQWPRLVALLKQMGREIGHICYRSRNEVCYKVIMAIIAIFGNFWQPKVAIFGNFWQPKVANFGNFCGNQKLPVLATSGNQKLPILATSGNQKLPEMVTAGYLKLPRSQFCETLKWQLYEIQKSFLI